MTEEEAIAEVRRLTSVSVEYELIGKEACDYIWRLGQNHVLRRIVFFCKENGDLDPAFSKFCNPFMAIWLDGPDPDDDNDDTPANALLIHSDLTISIM